MSIACELGNGRNVFLLCRLAGRIPISSHRGARRGAPGVVQLGEVGGQGYIVEFAAAEPSVEPAKRAGVGPPGVLADGSLD